MSTHVNLRILRVLLLLFASQMEEIPDFSVDEDDEASEANSLSLPNSN
jgi:hypothetical protein